MMLCSPFYGFKNNFQKQTNAKHCRKQVARNANEECYLFTTMDAKSPVNSYKDHVISQYLSVLEICQSVKESKGPVDVKSGMISMSVTTIAWSLMLGTDVEVFIADGFLLKTKSML